jgi:hypothetical protein
MVYGYGWGCGYGYPYGGCSRWGYGGYGLASSGWRGYGLGGYGGWGWGGYSSWYPRWGGYGGYGWGYADAVRRSRVAADLEASRVASEVNLRNSLRRLRYENDVDWILRRW